MFIHNSRLYESQMLANDIQERAHEALREHPEYTPVKVDDMPHATICSSWWGQSWCDNLERYVNWGNSVERGKKFVRNGAVIDLQINGGETHAHVIGTAIIPYEVKIKISAVSSQRQKEIEHIASGKIQKLEELASGNFPDDLKEALLQKGVLFPQADEIEFHCNCPDTSYMCPHVAATLYGIGVSLDSNPLSIFKLRGIDIEQLINATVGNKVENMLDHANVSSARILKNIDLAAIFGIGVIMKKLLPCPFCGHKNFEWDEIKGKQNLHWFNCLECGASISSAFTVEEVIKNWNRRAHKQKAPKAILRPCPCCGSTNIEQLHQDMWYSFRCKECGCESGGNERLSLALNDWNGRNCSSI